MAAKITVNSFFETIPIVSPSTFQLTYSVNWDNNEENWEASFMTVVGWGPQGSFQDTLDTATYAEYDANGAVLTKTSTVSPATLFTPFVQDGTFEEDDPDDAAWTIVNGTINSGGKSPGSATLNANTGLLSQAIYFQTGEYNLVFTCDNYVNVNVNGIQVGSFSAGTNTCTFRARNGLQTIEFAAVTNIVNISNVSITRGTGAITAPTTAPLVIAVLNGNNIVVAAVQMENIAPVTGSPQSRQAPIDVVTLTSGLVPAATTPLQPSSTLNN